jgi:hypothetical protein
VSVHAGVKRVSYYFAGDTPGVFTNLAFSENDGGISHGGHGGLKELRGRAVGVGDSMVSVQSY